MRLTRTAWLSTPWGVQVHADPVHAVPVADLQLLLGLLEAGMLVVIG